LLNKIAGGKRTEILRTENMGIVERIWDASPYPRKSEMYVVLTDLAAVTMAAATPEINNVKFLRDRDVSVENPERPVHHLGTGHGRDGGIYPQTY